MSTLSYAVAMSLVGLIAVWIFFWWIRECFGDISRSRSARLNIARPSVWPVYVAAAVVVLISVPLVTSRAGTYVSAGGQALYLRFLFQLLYGLFAVLTAVGMVLLRSWAWWCGVVFTAIWTVYMGALCGIVGTLLWPPRSGFAIMMGLFVVASWLGPTILLVAILTTRRQLFFPPKPEGEE